jgi:hypothetical protein
MTLSALGIFSAAGAGGVQGDYELIESVILGSNQASITFSSLATYASTYKHLQIRMVARSTTAIESRLAIMRFNNDSGTNYSFHAVQAYSDGTLAVRAEGGANTSAVYAFSLPAASITSNVFGSGVVDILDAFSTTKNKTVRGLGGYMGGTPGFWQSIGLWSSAWRNTAAITSIAIDVDSDFLAGSRFSLYGIKG